MSKFTLIVFISLVTTRMLNGAPFRTTNQKTPNIIETPNTKHYDASVCPDNCSFVFSQDSVITAQKTLEKFLHKRKSMLIYVTLYQKDLTLLPADRKKQNQIREWQWTLTENLWYVNLPIDLDYASFHITYYGESRIRLDIEAVDSNCCTIGDDAVNKVRDRLWFDVFSNKSGSLLCNRYFENQDWKISFFAVTTVWIGYDLLCVAPDVDKNYSEKSDTTATLLIPLFCFFIALYYPLLNIIIENPNIRNHLERVKRETGMKLTDYKQDDSPFGYRRFMLKYFFQTNLISTLDKQDNFVKILKFVPVFRLSILYFLVYLFMTIVPMLLEYKFDEEELTDFDTIYKLGLPVFHFGEKTQVHFTKLMCLTCLVYVPLIVAAKAYATYQFSENPDFLIFINLFDRNGQDVEDIIEEIKKEENKKRKGKEKENKTLNPQKSVSAGNHSNETQNSKKDESDVQHTNDIPKEKTSELTNQDTFINDVLKFKFYSKFIMRFNLLLSRRFWQHIWKKSGRECLNSHYEKSKNTKILNSEENSKRKIKNQKAKSKVQAHRFIVFIINVLLIVPMCAFPTIWFTLFPVFNRIRSWVPSKETKSRNPDPTNLEGTGEKDTQKPEQRKLKTLTSFLIHAVLLAWEFECIFLLYLDMSILIFIERSVMYIVFIAITNYDHLLRILIVVITCAGYLGLFITAFVEKYAIVLKKMFEQIESTKKESTCNDSIAETKPSPNETDKNTPKDVSSAKKDQGFISENRFDYVIDHSYAVREHFFFVILKIVITVMFFIVSLAILLQSNVFDSTTKLTNIIEFMVIIVTPKVVLKCVEKDAGSTMEDHTQDIKENTKNYETNDSDQYTESNVCIKCLSFFFCFARHQYNETNPSFDNPNYPKDSVNIEDKSQSGKKEDNPQLGNKTDNFKSVSQENNLKSVNKEDNFESVNKEDNFESVNKEDNFESVNKENNFESVNIEDNFKSEEKEDDVDDVDDAGE